MLRQPSLSNPQDPSGGDTSTAGERPAGDDDTDELDPRFCPRQMSSARGDLQQDIIDLLTPVDNGRLKEGMPNTDFNRRYPPDAWCEEAAPDARIWRVYKGEVSASDRDMLESWNKTLDVLLIFAGLFSAVSTAFIVESYKTLQPDYSEYVATFLYSAAVAYNKTGHALPPLDALRSPNGPFQSSGIERWINGLWFISLTVSLFVALLSILIKQWLDEYRTRVFRSAHDHASWARRHALYHTGLQSWRVSEIIACLPLLLHVSLFLFMSGLVLFLWLLDAAIAQVLLVLLVLTLGLYLLAMALPAFYIACPSTMPLTTHTLHSWSAWVLGNMARTLETVLRFTRIEAHMEQWTRPLGEREARVLGEGEAGLNATALAGLLNRTDDAGIVTVVAEAMSEFPLDSLHLLAKRDDSAINRIRQCIDSRIMVAPHNQPSAFEVTSFARCQRAYMALMDDDLGPGSGRALNLPALGSRRSLDFRAVLGIEGALLCALWEWEPSFTKTCGIRNLVAALRNLDWIPGPRSPGADGIVDSFAPLPKPAMHLRFCLLFLRIASRMPVHRHWNKFDIRDTWDPVDTSRLFRSVGHPLPHPSPHFYSLVMLVFCVARSISQPYSDEERDAAECLDRVVYHADPPRWASATCPERGSSYRERLRYRSIDALYSMLINMETYNVHPDVANLVARFAVSLVLLEPSSWSDHQGLSQFIRSRRFVKFSTSVEQLAEYSEALSRQSLNSVACGPQQLTEYLDCASILASRAASLNFSPGQYHSHLRGVLVEIAGHLRSTSRVDDEATLLCYFLEDRTDLDLWMKISWHGPDDDTSLTTSVLAMRTVLAGSLAVVLRRRLHLGQEIRDHWLLALFSNGTVRRIARSALEIYVDDTSALHADVGAFLRHWRALSPSSWSALCDSLVSTLDEPSAFQEAVEQFRKGIFLEYSWGGTALDCSNDCDCMRQHIPEVDSDLDGPTVSKSPAVQARGTWRNRWSNCLKHWKFPRMPESSSKAGQGVSTEV